MFVISVPYFDIDQTYMLYGNQLNWLKVSPKNYMGGGGGGGGGVSQQGPGDMDNTRDRFMFHCSEEDFFDVWFDYFDFRTDYQDLFKKNEKLGKSKFQSSGIHLVNRPLVESLICSFLAHKFSNFDCRSFSEKYGVKHKNSFRSLGTQTWYEFPDVETLKTIFRNDKETLDFLESIEWLEQITSYSSRDMFEFLKDMDFDNNLIQKLMLFGYHRFDVFPRDDFLDVYLSEEYRISRKDTTIRKRDSKGYLWLLLQFEMSFPGYDSLRWNLGLTAMREGKISEKEFEYEYCK